MNPTAPTSWEICRAVETLRAAGCVFSLSGRSATAVKLLSRDEVAEAIGMSVTWVKAHELEFPNRVKLPGGDVRIPVADLEAALLRWRVGFSTVEAKAA